MTPSQDMLKKINAGRTATIFRYGDEKVLKLYRPSFPEKVIDEEFQIGLQLNNVGLDVPHTHELVDYNGSKGIVFDFISGASMLQSLPKRPWKVFAYAALMAQLHFKIHSAQTSRVTGLTRLKETLHDKISRVSLLTSDEKELIISQLSELKDGSTICHGDFHPDNIIISSTRMVTVDWLTARIGNPVADVARTWLLLTMGTLPENKTALEVYLAKIFRDLFCRRYLSEYKKLSNYSHCQLEKWKLPIAAARLIENVSEIENRNLLKIIRSKLKTQSSP